MAIWIFFLGVLGLCLMYRGIRGCYPWQDWQPTHNQIVRIKNGYYKGYVAKIYSFEDYSSETYRLRALTEDAYLNSLIGQKDPFCYGNNKDIIDIRVNAGQIEPYELAR